jgi:hypothetical protein
VQTFLPYPDYVQSAKALDTRRLQKQIVECQQILNALINPNAKGWRKHPAALMWRGHEKALAAYAEACWNEWKNRGYGPDHKSILKIRELVQTLNSTDAPPAWLGRADVHASHRGNLLRKDFEHYSKQGWTESPDMDYVWPV